MDYRVQDPERSPELISRLPYPVIPNNTYLSAFDLSMGSQTHPQLTPERPDYATETPMECQATTEYVDNIYGSRKKSCEMYVFHSDPLNELEGHNTCRTTNSEGIGNINVSPGTLIHNQTLLPSDMSSASFPTMTPSLGTQPPPDWRINTRVVQNVMQTQNGWHSSYLSADDGLSDGDGPLTTLMAFTTDLASIGSLHSTATTRMHSPNMAANPTGNSKGKSGKPPQNYKSLEADDDFLSGDNTRPESKNKRGLAQFSEAGALGNSTALNCIPCNIRYPTLDENIDRLPLSSPQTPMDPIKQYLGIPSSAHQPQLPQSISSTPCSHEARLDFEMNGNYELLNQVARRHQSVSSSCVSDLHLGKGFLDSSWEEPLSKQANIPGKSNLFTSPKSLLAVQATQPHTSIVLETLFGKSETTLGRCLLDLRNVDDKSRENAISVTESSLSHLGVVFTTQSHANSPQTNRSGSKQTPIGTYETSSSCGDHSGPPSQSAKFQMRKPSNTPKNTFSVSHSTRPKGYMTPFSKLSRDESPKATMISSQRSYNPNLLPDEEADTSPNSPLKSNFPSRTLFQRRSPITMSLGKGLDCD